MAGHKSGGALVNMQKIPSSQALQLLWPVFAMLKESASGL